MDIISKLLLQQKYADYLSTDLELFRIERRNPYRATFRCHICGDSASSKRKKRGNIYEKDYNLIYGCYNCGYSKGFSNYLKEYNSVLYKEYVFELLQDKPQEKKYEAPSKKQEIKNNPLSALIQAVKNPKAYAYLKSRKIPEDKMDLFYYTNKFYDYINNIKPDEFSDQALKFDHDRLVIPMFDFLGSCYGVQGRSFDDEGTRYLTILFEDKAKFFGLERLDMKKKAYIVEGPIDSIFLDNCVAMTGADAKPENIHNNPVIVLDNQPRNKEVLQRYDKYINNGYDICIWPSSIKEKDINDLIISGYKSSDIQDIIDKNTFKGLKAKQKFKMWRKI